MPPSPVINVTHRLREMAQRLPQQIAIAQPTRRGCGKHNYRTVTFDELEQLTNRLASGLQQAGFERGMRAALLVKPSVEFIALVFALLRAGIVQVLIDPGMGRKNLVRCLSEAAPQGFIAIPAAQAVRCVLASRFPQAKLNVTVGRRWFWGGPTLDQIIAQGSDDCEIAATTADEDAAIIFTSGSTGPPKGVLYRHATFDRQVAEISAMYNIQPGGVDLPGFPLFGLFNAAMGVTTVIPRMNPSRPARLDPAKFIDAINTWQAMQSFGSPAIWNRVGRYAQSHGITLPSIRNIYSAGAPVPPHVLSRLASILPADAQIHTPYGATEALPIATISAAQVLGETAVKSAQGAGTCVGSKFPGIEWRIIAITDEAIDTIDQATELPSGQIGELIVRGDVVSREYVTRREANAVAKIADGSTVWHRMGDVGYFDEQHRFWFCGRMAHRVQTAAGTMFSVPCEEIFNQHPSVYRSALVGAGQGIEKRPVIVVEPWPEHRPCCRGARRQLLEELRNLAKRHELTRSITDFLIVRNMPVDVRHNAKIRREDLAIWATRRI